MQGLLSSGVNGRRAPALPPTCRERASKSSPEDHSGQGALWSFQLRYPPMWTLSWVPAPSETVFSPQEATAGEDADPGIRHLALPRSLSNLGQTLCPHLHRWVVGPRVPSAGRAGGRQACWGRALGWKSCRPCVPLGPDNRGGPQLPPRGSVLLHLQPPGPENPQRHWRLGPGNSAAPCIGSLALLVVARLGGHVNSRPVLGGGSMAQGLHEAQTFGRM